MRRAKRTYRDVLKRALVVALSALLIIPAASGCALAPGASTGADVNVARAAVQGIATALSVLPGTSSVARAQLRVIMLANALSATGQPAVSATLSANLPSETDGKPKNDKQTPINPITGEPTNDSTDQSSTTTDTNEQAYEEPVATDPPYVEEPVYEEPVATDPPYVEEPVYEEPVYEEPVYEEPVYEEPEGPTLLYPGYPETYPIYLIEHGDVPGDLTYPYIFMDFNEADAWAQANWDPYMDDGYLFYLVWPGTNNLGQSGYKVTYYMP